MSKHYYKLLIDSPTGKRLTEFWHSCISVERLAEKYAKRMGGEFYYSDPKYFAGGVSVISFPGNRPSDPQMWREVGTQHADGSFVDVREPDYKGATAAGDVVYFEPNVRKRIDWEELPTKDFRPADTFDCIHSAIPPIERDGKWFVQVCRFEYDEPPGRSGNGQRVASRSVRKAIKAEVQRNRLPVMRVEPLFDLLGADLQPKTDGGGADGRGTAVNSTKGPTSTPTFFAYEHYYIIGCDYPCSADGLVEISAQTHRTFQDMHVRQMQRKEN